MTPSTKPKQRRFVHDLMVDVHAGLGRDQIIIRLYELLLNLRNRPPVKRGDPAAATVTPAMKRRIRAMYRANPTITNQHIADALNLNAGRVSEVLAGKRV